jgi:hypothetical protein
MRNEKYEPEAHESSFPALASPQSAVPGLRGLYTSAQDLERNVVFWKRFLEKRAKGANFSRIGLHGMRNLGIMEVGVRLET